MIGVESQYILKIAIGDFEDFIEKEDFVSLLVVEEAGGYLPSFELNFYTDEEDIIPYLNEGNEIKISLGKDKNALLDYSMKIMSIEKNRVGNSKYQIVLQGLYNKLKYMSDCNIYISDKKSGVEEILRISGQYFNNISNISNSSDSQYWIQSNISDRAFISDLWLRSYIPGSFPVIGISSEGDFILNDVRILMGTNPKFEFVPKGKKKKNQILFDPGYTDKTTTGVVNQWMGYNREKSLFGIDDGTESILNPSFSPFLAQTPSLNRTADITKKVDDFDVLTENVHSKYHEAYVQNTTYLGLFSTVKLPISFTGVFEHIKILDLVYFKDRIAQNVDMASEYDSGLYLVSLVARQITNSQFKTTVILNRESGNAMRGELS
jgi:hypothetical protein